MLIKINRKNIKTCKLKINNRTQQPLEIKNKKLHKIKVQSNSTNIPLHTKMIQHTTYIAILNKII